MMMAIQIAIIMLLYDAFLSEQTKVHFSIHVTELFLLHVPCAFKE